MITFGLLFPFIGNMIFLTVTGGWNKETEEEEEVEDDDSGEAKGDDGEKKSLKEKMQAMQEIALQIQKHLGFLAHVLESIKNVFNFSVPFLSWLAFVVILIVTIVLYFVPLRSDKCFVYRDLKLSLSGSSFCSGELTNSSRSSSSRGPSTTTSWRTSYPGSRITRSW